MDLNLLPVFQAIHKHRHITNAAKALGISQPALSHALARLRTSLGDPLFVKSSQGMVPTPKALSLVSPIDAVLQTIEGQVISATEFKPETLERTFQIATTDMIESCLGPTLLAVVANAAPKVGVSLISPGFALPQKALEQGTCDLAIAGFFGTLPDGFYQQSLFKDGFVSCLRKDHPALKKKLTLSAFCDLEHVLISPGGEMSGSVDRQLRKLKRARTVKVGTSGFLSAGHIVANTDYVLTAPSRLVEIFERTLPVRQVPTPLKLSPIQIVQVWHARNHNDGAHRWLRNLVKESLAG